jgi:hypothetical protein
VSVKVYGAVSRYSRATGNARVVLQLLADAAADDGRWRIAQATLAMRANITTRTVARAVARLVDLGELVVEEPGTGHGSTLYRVVVTGTPVAPEPTVLSTQGGQSCHPRVDTAVDHSGPSTGPEQLAAREEDIDEPAVAEFARCRPDVRNPRHVWSRSLTDVERDEWRQRWAARQPGTRPRPTPPGPVDDERPSPQRVHELAALARAAIGVRA